MVKESRIERKQFLKLSIVTHLGIVLTGMDNVVGLSKGTEIGTYPTFGYTKKQ